MKKFIIRNYESNKNMELLRNHDERINKIKPPWLHCINNALYQDEPMSIVERARTVESGWWTPCPRRDRSKRSAPASDNIPTPAHRLLLAFPFPPPSRDDRPAKIRTERTPRILRERERWEREGGGSQMRLWEEASAPRALQKVGIKARTPRAGVRTPTRGPCSY